MAINYPLKTGPADFYGNPLVWNSYLEDKDKFIDMFQLRNTTKTKHVIAKPEDVLSSLMELNYTGILLTSIDSTRMSHAKISGKD